MRRISLTVNDMPVAAEVTPRTQLAEFLREHLLLTGTHIGCEHGICGACTVEIDGEIARSCITYAVTCDGAHIRTIEGFDDDALMADLRRAFAEAHALQCGYCTPGVLIAARDLVRRKSGLNRGEIRAEMSGNLCRCTGYVGIVDAIERVMAGAPPLRGSWRQTMDGEGKPGEPASARANAWLGPAPGPVAAPTAAPPTAGASGPPPAAPAPRLLSQGRGRPPIEVTVEAPADVGGESRIRQSFVLPHPREAVWRLMSDVAALARCMPGLALDGPPSGDKVSGRLEASLGPIRASFAGEGTLRRFPGDFRQVVTGTGGDPRSGSRASGSVDYRLTAVTDAAGREATRVDVIIGYGLTGPLAQIGRGGLVRDLVRRIGEALAQNLDARLCDPTAALPQARLGGLSLLLKALADQARAFFSRLFNPRR
ncbi:MAG TPA: 2Fe-2S iron-sulfur cluster-binding protein [Hyphomicrobiaceae bacterium]|jgi:carbon-monoxide dehydrogenase small subunit